MHFWEESEKGVYGSTLSISVSKYVDYHHEISIDGGYQLTSGFLATILPAVGIMTHPSGLECHDALQGGRQYYSYSHRVQNKWFRAETLLIWVKDALVVVVKAVNRTLGSEKLVPTLLVFYVMPPISKKSYELEYVTIPMKAFAEYTWRGGNHNSSAKLENGFSVGRFLCSRTPDYNRWSDFELELCNEREMTKKVKHFG